jgi:mRNA-degrading endonuclease toxin of MazEF toxin-antitoxin module
MRRYYGSYAGDLHGSNIREDEQTRRKNFAQAMSSPSYKKWDIVMVEFGQAFDCCLIRGYRPAIVYSGNEYNENSPIMQVIPLTRKMKGVDRDYHVFLDKHDCIGYESSGIALIEQIRPVDRKYVNRKVGEIDDFRAIDKIDEAVAEFFGFETE